MWPHSLLGLLMFGQDRRLEKREEASESLDESES